MSNWALNCSFMSVIPPNVTVLSPFPFCYGVARVSPPGLGKKAMDPVQCKSLAAVLPWDKADRLNLAGVVFHPLQGQCPAAGLLQWHLGSWVWRCRDCARGSLLTAEAARWKLPWGMTFSLSSCWQEGLAPLFLWNQVGSCLRRSFCEEQKRVWFPWECLWNASVLPHHKVLSTTCIWQGSCWSQRPTLRVYVTSGSGEAGQEGFFFSSWGASVGSNTGQPWEAPALSCVRNSFLWDQGARVMSPIMAFLSEQFLCVLKMPSHLHSPSLFCFLTTLLLPTQTCTYGVHQ